MLALLQLLLLDVACNQRVAVLTRHANKRQSSDRLIFITAVFPHQRADADQLGDVRNLFAFAALLAVQFAVPVRGAVRRSTAGPRRSGQ